jgi:hypothetical protein
MLVDFMRAFRFDRGEHHSRVKHSGAFASHSFVLPMLATPAHKLIAKIAT